MAEFKVLANIQRKNVQRMIKQMEKQIEGSTYIWMLNLNYDSEETKWVAGQSNIFPNH